MLLDQTHDTRGRQNSERFDVVRNDDDGAFHAVGKHFDSGAQRMLFRKQGWSRSNSPSFDSWSRSTIRSSSSVPRPAIIAIRRAIRIPSSIRLNRAPRSFA